MLRSFGIRAKILAVLALPVLVLGLAAGVIATSAATEASKAQQVEALTEQAAGLSELLRGLQAERALTVAVLSGEESRRPALEEVRTAISAQLEQVRENTENIDISRLDEASQAGYAATQEAHALLPGLRRQVDGEVLIPSLAQERYSEIIDTDIALPTAIADGVADRELAQQLRGYSATLELADAITGERDVSLPAVALGGFDVDTRDAAVDAARRTELIRERTDEVTQSAGVRTPATGYTLQLARQRTIDDADLKFENITVDYWVGAFDEDAASLNNGLDKMIDQAGDRSSQLSGEANTRAVQVVVGAILAVLIPVLLALYLARRITRPLRRLTEAAGQIRRDLPLMVEQMATPGEGPEITLPQIPVESKDEIGRLAAAFNEVNSTTVAVAQEQAALRGSIAAMFVNVARRDQVLLSRQLSFLDQLERTEENPETLDNLFKLDHLATRMRRNAESLLVLAGIDTGRRLRRPMPLSDVVRTASSEIEHYERVDLAQHVDPPMVGHAALLTAHMLAELLENATAFSDPLSRVVVTTDTGPDGVRLTILDEGLGMSTEELDEVNERIMNPPVSEVVGAQRLGFYVVGRLARRLEATVMLQKGEGRGTVAVVDLPPSLFTPGSVEDPNAPTEERPSEAADVDRPAQEAISNVHALEHAAEAVAAAAAEVAADTMNPRIVPVGQTEGLPQRGVAELPKRGGALPARTPAAEPAPTEVEAPVAQAPVAQAPVAQAPVQDAPVLPKRGDLPTRTRPAPVAPVEVPSVPAQRREPTKSSPGLFTGFRARRAEAVGGSGAEAAEVEDAPAPAVPEVRPEVEAAPTALLDVAELDDPAPPAPVFNPAAGVASLEPEAVPAAPQAPAEVPAEMPAQAPAAKLNGRRTADPSTQRRSAASELSALASQPAPAPVAEPEPAPVAPVFSSASALDILPGAQGRSRGLKMPGRSKQQVPGAVDQPNRVTFPTMTAQQLATTAAEEVPAPYQPTMVPSATPLTPGPAESTEEAQPVLSSGRDVLRQRSAMASQALSELSRLSSYRPDATVNGGSAVPAPLTRRTRGASAAAEVAPVQAAVPSRPGRTAAEVRSMLSGFQAGVNRGRHTPEAAAQSAAAGSVGEEGGR